MSKVTHQQRFGLENGNSILTTREVDQIRAHLAAGEPTRWIARQFDVSQSTIMQIKKGLTWQQAST